MELVIRNNLNNNDHNNPKSFGFSLETILLSQQEGYGVGLNSANKNAAVKSFAHLIIKVDRESVAHAAGLRKGDRIIELDGINVEADDDQRVSDRVFQAFAGSKQLALFVVDPDTDEYFRSRCIKMHSMLPIVKHVTNFSDN